MKSAHRANIALLALAGVWVVLGAFFGNSTHLGWLPKWVLTFAVLSPLAWIILYTVQGIAGHGKWWSNDVGSNMVWMEAAFVLNGGLLLWALWFNHGAINGGAMAWAYLGGELASGIIINWRSVIWLRSYRKEPPMLTRIRELEAEIAGLRRSHRNQRPPA